MDKTIRRQLKIALSLVLFLSYAALTTTFEFRSGFLLVWPLILIVIMPLGEWLDNRFALYRTITTGVTVAISALLLATIQNNGLLFTLTFLLIYIQSYSMVHVKREQTYNHILLMSFFMLLAAAVMSPSANIGFVLILFLVAASWTLLLLEVGIASQSAKMIRVEDLMESGGNDSRGAGLVTRLLDLRMAGWIMAFSILLLFSTSVVFTLVPRTEAGMLGTMMDDTTFTTGIGDEVDLSLGGTIAGNASPVMQVWFPENEGGVYGQEMYWRVTTLDSYEENVWSRRGLISRGSSRDIDFRRFYCTATSYDLDRGIQRTSFDQGELIHFKGFIDKLPDSGVPSLQMIHGMRAVQGERFASLTWDTTGDFTVHMTTKGDKGVELEGWAEVYTPSDDELQASTEDYMSVMVPSDYRLLTQYSLTSETLALVERLVEGRETAFEKLEALEAYITSGNFVYTTEIPELSVDNPIDSFILTEKQGHCELYASALTMMARSQGIPTRMVKGYRGGIWDNGDKAYTVVNNMAHVWVEAYFPDVGWVTYDPSPPIGDVPLFSLEGVSQSYSKWSMKVRMFWLRSVIGYAPDEQYMFLKESTFELFQSFGIGEQSDEGRKQVSLAGRIAAVVIWFGLITFMIGFGFILYRIWIRLHRVSGPMLSADQKRARNFMETLHGKLSRLGVDCHGVTAEDLIVMFSNGELLLNDDLADMLEFYNKVRFGNMGLTVVEFKSLRSRVRHLALSV